MRQHTSPEVSATPTKSTADRSPKMWIITFKLNLPALDDDDWKRTLLDIYAETRTDDRASWVMMSGECAGETPSVSFKVFMERQEDLDAFTDRARVIEVSRLMIVAAIYSTCKMRQDVLWTALANCTPRVEHEQLT